MKLEKYRVWYCTGCSFVASFDTEAEALAWANQPVPFLPEVTQALFGRSYEKGMESAIYQITAALAVREEEQ